MQMTTVFDGVLPAGPGENQPGEAVVVWTPTRDGVYAVLIVAPEEEGAPFSYAGAIAADLDAAGGAFVDPIMGSGSVAGEFQSGATTPPGSATLATPLDHDVRVVVKVGVVTYADGVTPGETSIVPLDELKLALGLDVASTDDDLLLTLLEQQAAAYVETQIGRRFSVPTDRTEFIKGLGVETLFLGGHAASGIQSVRARARTAREFDDVEAEDYDVRGDTIVLLGGRWSHLYEYEVVYADGYDLGSAPADVRALVIDLVSIAFSGLGEEGVKSESIGDYSYTLDSAVTAASASLSDTSSMTLNRYRRMSI